MQSMTPRTGRPPLPPEDRRKRASWRLAPHVLERLQWLAEKRGQTQTAILEELINREYSQAQE